ncbi:MAG TPA: IS481 family transposase [Stellaceae bacterium]|nr:IS481 family transposase [Stellaceae bacterium]
MPWGEVSIMSLRLEFVMLARQEGANIRALCRGFGVQPRIGYKWLARYAAAGEAGLADRSRQPKHSPDRTPAAMEELVLAVRDAHPCWGGRKIRRRLQDLGHDAVPSASTVTAVLHRHQRIDAAASAARERAERFERAAPNELWQMDFKGHFPIGSGRCHPLTVLDDHSRYALGLRACGNETEGTVQGELEAIFRRYGLPDRMLMDNGSPWGSANAEHRYTAFELWLIERGVAVSHGRPYHPQTQGKDERFHRTLAEEAIGRRGFADLAACQRRFDQWRHEYNTERPHDALGLATPITRYRPSHRTFPETIEPYDYGPGAILRRVDEDGWLSFRHRPLKLGRAFIHRRIALRPALPDGCFDAFFCGHKVATFDLREAAP